MPGWTRIGIVFCAYAVCDCNEKCVDTDGAHTGTAAKEKRRCVGPAAGEQAKYL